VERCVVARDRGGVAASKGLRAGVGRASQQALALGGSRAMQVICRCYASSCSFLARTAAWRSPTVGLCGLSTSVPRCRPGLLAAPLRAGVSYWAMATCTARKRDALSALRNADRLHSNAMSWRASPIYRVRRHVRRAPDSTTADRVWHPSERLAAPSALCRCLQRTASTPCASRQAPAASTDGYTSGAHAVLPARQRSTSENAVRPERVAPWDRQWPADRSNSLSGPIGTPHSAQLRFLTLPTVTRLMAEPNHPLSSQQGLPALWRNRRFCLSSPSITSPPARAPLSSALVQPPMTESSCTRTAPTCRKNKLLHPLVYMAIMQKPFFAIYRP
jgi:hypothetical protein